MAPSTANQTQTTPRVSSDEALRTARLDAEKAYRDLARYRIVVAFLDGAWHVDYELQGLLVAGGGPHYIIDAGSGAILSKRYEQ